MIWLRHYSTHQNLNNKDKNVSKSLKDILSGIKSSKMVPGSTGTNPGVDYEPIQKDQQDLVKLHKTEKHADRVGNGDEDLPDYKLDSKHGHKKPNDQKVYENGENICNNTPEGTNCPVHLMDDCNVRRVLRVLKEIITKKTSAGNIIKDFQKSKNPKFSGKSTEERKRMALGAYYSMHPELS